MLIIKITPNPHIKKPADYAGFLFFGVILKMARVGFEPTTKGL
jgi:hypothetical protein